MSVPERKFEYADADKKRPPVPTTKDEPPLLGLKTTKNFVTKNAVETIMSVPGIPDKKYADTRIGDTHNLIPSGLEPKYVHKKVGYFLNDSEKLFYMFVNVMLLHLNLRLFHV